MSRIQEEREERHKYKHQAKQQVVTHHPAPEPDLPSRHENESGSFDNGDPNTTNLYLGNLSPKVSFL